MQGTRQVDGSSGWVIFDPLRHCYFQISLLAVQILNLWRTGSASAIQAELERQRLTVSPSDIENLTEFLFANNLTLEAKNGDSAGFARQAAARKRNWWQTALHHYLFFRIPLVRPDKFLRRSLPWISFLFSRGWLAVVLLCGCLGLYLAMRQWDEYVRTFVYFFNFKGMLLYAISLVLIKIAHELGHAYTATRYGCRVTVMGLAFLVMFPVLYTDTTDSWRITSRRRRLMIDAAGVIVELMVAVFATFFWAFLPDGFWRSAAFFLATTSWLLSISVNANPLMRFDGYYFLSDAIGVQNLQTRSFALGRWALRELLFNLQSPAPEVLPWKRVRFLILFAWATWIYRFFLFLGIALLVYHFFFKSLGIVLFLIEIYWFITKPVINEIKQWIASRQEIVKAGRVYASAAWACLGLVVFLLPWSTSISIPAIQEASEQQVVHCQYPGVIKSLNMRHGQQVIKGDLLLEIASPRLDFEISQTQRRIALLVAQLGRITVDIQDRERALVLQRELKREQERLQGLRLQYSNLNIHAPLNGRIVDLEKNLHSGRWINPELPLAIVISDTNIRIRGYVRATDVERLENNAKAVFIPENHQRSTISGRLVHISRAHADTVTLPALTSRHGGDIPVADTLTELRPLETWYDTVMNADHSVDMTEKSIRGEIHATGKAESIAERVWRQAMRVIIRESSV